MNAVQFYNPSSTAPLLSARCAATVQKYCQSTGILYRKQQSCVLELYSQSQNTGKDIAGKQDDYASDSSIAADKDNEFLLVDKVICCVLHLEDSTKKPTNSALAAKGTNEASSLNSSGSSILAQSSLQGYLDGSKGTYIDSALLQTKQLLINAQSSQLYLTTITTMTTTTIMTILIAQAAEASLAI